MSMTRRDLLKVTGLSAAVAMLGGCTSLNQPQSSTSAKASTPMMLAPKAKGNRVVVVGAGFGGLSVAKSIRQNNPKSEVIVLEKRDIFMSCPFSNTYLGELDGVSLDSLTRDFYAPAREFGYTFIQCEVTDINRASKMVMTSQGAIDYDYLVLAPGISYDYKKQFPQWDDMKIHQISQQAPGALITGSEHLSLKRMLENMEDGNVVITVPSGKYRCPPAPYERACMVAHYMNQEEIEGKVIILDAALKPRAKAAAFEEAFNDLYKDRIEFVGGTTIDDVDLEAKKIMYTREDKDLNVTKHTLDYQVLNLIPMNRANTVIEMADIETNAWGAARLKGAGFTSVSDSSIYVIGDSVGHAIPPSGQTANWAGKRAGVQIAQRLMGNKVDEMANLPFRNANVCYSMVNGDPEEAVMVTHNFSYNGTVLVGKGTVPKAGGSKFRSNGVGRLTHEWYRGIISDMFGA